MVDDPANPAHRLEMPRRIARFGAAGRLTVVASLEEDAGIEPYPAARVLAVTDQREVGVPAHRVVRSAGGG